MGLPLVVALSLIAPATERLHGSIRLLAMVAGTLSLVPILGELMRRLQLRIRAKGWGRSAYWCVAVLASGLILEPGSGVSGGPAFPLWWAKVISLGAIAVLSVLLLASIPDQKPRPVSIGLAAACAGGYVASASVWLLAFWPGVMTVDSVIQWQQVLTGKLTNEHPAFHTGILWLTSLGGMSPALAVFAQVLLFGFAFAYCLVELQRWGTPRWVLITVSVIFTLMPANMLLAVTLWKDIPFTALTLLLSVLTLQLARTRGSKLEHPGFVAAFTLIAAAICLLRHNGMLLVAGLAVVLPIMVPSGLKRRAFGVMAAALALYVVTSGPVYKALGVKSADQAFVAAIPIHHMGAFMNAVPEAFTEEDVALLAELQPVSIWQSNYLCYSVNPILHHALDKSRFPAVSEQFIRKWAGLVLSHPTVILRHQACVSSLVWAVRGAKGPMYLGSREVSSNSMGLTSAPKLDAPRRLMERALAGSAQAGQVWWMWGTALYLYLAVAVAISTRLRTGSFGPALFVLPALLNALALAAVNVAPDFRYMYPLYVVGLISLALPFVATCGRRGEGEGSGSATRMPVSY